MRLLPTLLAILILTASAVMAAESIGRVIALEGAAQAIRDGGKSVDLQIKSDIFLNDKVVTGKGDKLQIMFNDDTVISQGESSDMTIDEYVYSKKNEKDASCSMKFLGGVFRTVTGKVTKLNPDRFKVKTRMATIGIRGCELAFKIQPTREDVYVLELSKGESIVIESAAGLAQDNLDTRQNIINVVQSGMAVQIRPGTSMKEKPITSAEFMKILHESGPNSRMPAAAEEDDSSSSSTLPATGDAIGQAAAAANQSRSAEILAGTAQTLQQETRVQEELPPKPPEPTTPPYVAPPASLPPSLVLGHPDLTDWEIALWDDGSSQYKPNTYQGAAVLPLAEFQTIVGDAIPHNLTGSGLAAGVLSDLSAGYRVTVQGTCNLDVHVGGPNPLTWGGNFSMSKGADNLTFIVDSTTGGGGFLPDGTMTLNALSFYDMNVGGKNFKEGTLTTKTVEGSLIKPGLGTPPISAAAGKFDFQHGTEASAKGTFGANIQ